MDDHEPQLSNYRQKQALQAYEEAQETMNPTEVQIAEILVDYASSSAFFSLITLIILYRIFKPVLQVVADKMRDEK